MHTKIKLLMTVTREQSVWQNPNQVTTSQSALIYYRSTLPYHDNNYQQAYIKAPKQQKKDSHYSTTLHQEKHSKFNITTTLLTQCLKYFLKLSTHTCWE